MKTTETHNRDILAIQIALIVLALSSALIGLWWLTGQAVEQVDTLRAWAVLATLAVPSAAAAGYRLGRIEAHGFLSGADRVMDRLIGLVRDVSTIRDTSRITIHQATRNGTGAAPLNGGLGLSAPQVWGIPMPPPPRLTYRTTESDDVDSL